MDNKAEKKRMAESTVGGEVKRQRLGVGSSVVDFPKSPADDFILILTKLSSERLRPKKSEVVTIGRTDALPDAAKLMLDNNFLTLPVCTLKGTFHGFIEQKDIVKYILNVFLRDFSTVKYRNVEKIFAAANMYANTMVQDAMITPVKLRRSNFILSPGTKLFRAWEILAREGIHRVPVVDESGRIIDIITQSMLVDFLWQNLEKIGKVADMMVGDLWNNKTVETVRDNTQAYYAFRKMIKKNVSGLAVIDREGKLVDNISYRDFRGIHSTARTFWRLWDSVKDFKMKVELDIPTDVKFTKPVYVVPTDTLSMVVEKMALNHIHRVYVVESTSTMKPVNVISQTDVLAFILQAETEIRE
jgi:CBS domain-containing protein